MNKKDREPCSFCYIRVSTSMQAEDGDSLAMQKEQLINYSKVVLGVDNCVVFEDAGYSAKNTDRPSFKEMMTRIRNREADYILVWKLDRISRNVADFANMWQEFEKYDVKFVSKMDNFQTDTPMGRAVLNILMSFAQLEREMTSMRVKEVMKDRAARGMWNGSNVPLGYKFDYDKKFPVPDEKEIGVVKLIYDKYEELRSTKKVSALLNDQNIPTKRGGVWSSMTIQQILTNPFYKGTLRYNYRKSSRGKIKSEDEWVVLENNHEAIISGEQWDAVQTIMDGNRRKPMRKIQSKNVHIFSGLLECYECGGGFSAYADRERKDGFKPSMYRCSNVSHARKCNTTGFCSDMLIGEFVLNYMSNMLSIKKDFREEDIEQRLLSGAAFKDIAYVEQQSIQDFIQIINGSYVPNDMSSDGKEDIDKELEELIKKKAKIERALKRLSDLYLFDDEAMSEREYLLKKNEFVKNLNEIDLCINSKSVNKNTDLLVDNKLLSKCVLDWKLGSGEYIKYKNLANGLDPLVLKDFFNQVLEKVVIGRERKIHAIIFKNGLTQKFLYR